MLYVLWIQVLGLISGLPVFPILHGLPFYVFLVVFFSKKPSLILRTYYLTSFLFCFMLVVFYLKYIYLPQGSHDFFLILSSRSFLIVCIMFGSMILLELNTEYLSCDLKVDAYIYPGNIHLIQQCLLKSLSHWIASGNLSRLNGPFILALLNSWAVIWLPLF